MNIIVLDENFVSVSVLDNFSTLIWTDKYNAFGDFEITASVSSGILSIVQENYYLINQYSDHLMIVESVELKDDAENGDYVVVKGRSLETILFRRIVWNQTVLFGSLEMGIKKILDENAIVPTLTERRISNLIFQLSVDPYIGALTVDTQCHGDYLYDIIASICLYEQIGFKITLDSTARFVFGLYSGKDHSFDQTLNDVVIFSPKLDNLSGSRYLRDSSRLKTVALIGGEGEGSARQTTSVSITTGPGTGLNRRELFVDASNISRTVPAGTLTDVEYYPKLRQAGLEKLTQYEVLTFFDGQIEETLNYGFGVHYELGDIVQISNEYGMESKSRITEIITSQDSSGFKRIPTFSTIQ